MEEERAEYLVEQYSDMILRLGYSWLGDMDDAMDICQEVLLKLLTDERTFPDQGQERAWVVRLAINQCKNWKKSAWFRHRAPLEDGLHLVAETPEPEDGSLLEKLRRLPAKYRQVIYLRYYEGYEVHEIAQLLGCSAGLVSTHLARAKIKLREQLEGTCCEV